MVFQATTVVLVAAKTATLVFGGALTHLAYKAYRRTGSYALRALAIGIGLLVVGATLGGVFHQFLGIGLGVSVSVQSVFTALGLAVMTYSLYVDTPSRETRTSSGTNTGG